ncbi:MAG: HAMP domain-containing histidine kinase [Candidatus Jacksonbacteria bacterium]|nr:HAMP domain-containing histidine kinase [Candidatus Jacksonbacteria bacterium]
MIGIQSILILFATTAMGGIGILSVLGFIRRVSEHSEKRYFYTLALCSFTLGSVLLGLSSFTASILYFLVSPEAAAIPTRYLFFAIPIVHWLEWAVLVNLFTGKKSAWHIIVFGFVLAVSSLLFLTVPMDTVNEGGIVSPQIRGNDWRGILFAIESTVMHIATVGYILFYRFKQKRLRKPIGYINMLLAAFLFFMAAFFVSGIYIAGNEQNPIFYVLSWLFATSAVFCWYLGLIAVDDGNQMLLFNPFLYIQRSVRMKMILVVNTLVWVTVVGIVLIITSIVNKILAAYIDIPEFRQLFLDAARAEAWVLLVSVLILGITTFIVVLFITSILYPISEIKKGVRRIGLGEFSYRITDITKDELGRLAMEFNDMAASLQSKTKQIVRLQEIDKVKSQFVSVASHQLRTPLTSSRWALTLLMKNNEKNPMSKENNILIQEVYASTMRMITLVNTLLDVSKLESGGFSLTREQVVVSEIIHEILQGIHQLIENKRLRVETSFPSTARSVAIAADKVLLRTALENVITNGVEYNKKGGSLAVKVKNMRGDVLVTVADTGIGIASTDAQNMFSKFYRGKEATMVQTDGSGLGLFLTKLIIEAHKGTIWFESAHGQGTTFYIKLPKLGLT